MQLASLDRFVAGVANTATDAVVTLISPSTLDEVNFLRASRQRRRESVLQYVSCTIQSYKQGVQKLRLPRKTYSNLNHAGAFMFKCIHV